MLPITKLTESLMDNQNKAEKDEFLCIDPEVFNTNENSETTKPYFNEAVVFVIGGGNYFEYQNLMEFAKVSFRIKNHVSDYLSYAFIYLFFFSKKVLICKEKGLYMGLLRWNHLYNF